MLCSNLNAHLYNLHVVDNPFCLCSNSIVEDCKHFFFECPLYNVQRMKLIDNVMKSLFYEYMKSVTTEHAFTARALLNG